MGSRTDEAERRVRAQRTLIERKIADLEARTGDDFAEARRRVAHHLTHLPETVPGGEMVLEQAREHPFATLAGSLGLGVALGMATGGDANGRSGRNGHEGGGMPGLGGLMGATTGAVGGLAGLGAAAMAPLRPYVEDLARQAVAGFAERQRAREGSDGASAGGEGDALPKNC
jgi:hypothetical protein